MTIFQFVFDAFSGGLKNGNRPFRIMIIWISHKLIVNMMIICYNIIIGRSGGLSDMYPALL